MNGTKGFSLVELMVVVAIIALLITILIPTLTRAEEQARQAKCMANLKGLYTGWSLYTRDNNGAPPILPDVGAVNTSGPGGSTSAWLESLKMGDECTAASLGRGAQQNLCLLVKINAVPWEMFLCPSTHHNEADRSGSGRKFGMGETSGGAEIGYCDYGIQAPYRYGRGWNRNRCPITSFMDGGVVILGDRGPRRWHYTYTVGDWSQNHPDSGESILFAAGNVRFSKDKAYDSNWEAVIKNTGGWGGNCIYTPDRWDTSDPDNPILLYNGVSHAGGWGKSTKDTVLFWWPEES